MYKRIIPQQGWAPQKGISGLVREEGRCRLCVMPSGKLWHSKKVLTRCNSHKAKPNSFLYKLASPEKLTQQPQEGRNEQEAGEFSE